MYTCTKLQKVHVYIYIKTHCRYKYIIQIHKKTHVDTQVAYIQTHIKQLDQGSHLYETRYRSQYYPYKHDSLNVLDKGYTVKILSVLILTNKVAQKILSDKAVERPGKHNPRLLTK